MLQATLTNAGVAEQAESIFLEWPEIEMIAAQYLRYVSPWLIVGEDNLAEMTLRDAFKAREGDPERRRSFPHRSLIEAITQSVPLLASVRISVLNGENLWTIWSYDEPLTTWMEKHGRSAMQIRPRETSVVHGPLLIKMLAFVSSTRDLELAEIAFNSPFESIHA